MHHPLSHRAHLQLLHQTVEGVEQPTAQEPSVPEAEVRTTVDRRFSGVNVRIYLVASMIVAVLLGGLMLWSELANLKNGLANLIRPEPPAAKLGDPGGQEPQRRK